MKTTVPDVSGSIYSGDGSVRVRHREFFSDVLGSVAFANTQYPINPGLAMFPWLQSIASRYESYVFNDLCFEYETQTSVTEKGTVILAVDFDASDDAPINKQGIMSYHNAVRSAVWEECQYKASKQDLKKFGVQRYCRLGSVPSGTDIKTYDVGTLNIATKGCDDAAEIGEIYVSYDITFHTPQLDQNISIAANSALLTSGGTVSDTAFLGTANVITGQLPVTATGSTITFNKVGSYLLDFNIEGTGITDAMVSPITGTGIISGFDLVAYAAGTQGKKIGLVKVNNIGETVIADFSAATTVTSSTVRIASYLYSLG